MNRLLHGALGTTLVLGASLAQAETTLRVGLNADIRSTEPGVNRDENTDTVMLHVVEGLVAHREDSSVGPLLAREVLLSSDGMTYTFKLRDKVRFQNGETLTSKEVKWTWERYLNPRNQWRCLAEFDGRGGAKITGIETPDPLTVVFHLDQPSGLFLTSMARPDCAGSGILHPDSLAADGTWRQPIGTGPFSLTEWKPGQYTLLSRFKNYSLRDEAGPDGFTGKKQALVDEVRFMVIPDPSSAKAALMSNNIDLLPNVSASDAQELKATPGVQISSSPIMAICGLLFQTKDPLLKDVRIRKAIAYSLDYGQMVDALSNGASEPNNSAISQTSPFYSATAKQGYRYDPQEARRLLKEAGYHGQPIKMFVNKRYMQMFDMGLLSQAMAASSGLNVQMETLEWGTQLERYQSGNYQMMAFSYSSRLDPATSFDSLMGDKTKEPRKVWDNPQAQAVLRDAVRQSDTAKRQELFDQLHRMMIDDTPLVIIYNGMVSAALRDSVKGFHSWPVSSPRVWGVSLATH